MGKPQVRAVGCDYISSREEVYQAVKKATDPLSDMWDRLSRAKTIAIKFNQDKPPERVVLYEGRRQQLVTDEVVYATLRLLRERTGAKLFCADISAYVRFNKELTVAQTTQITHLLEEFDVEYLDGTGPPFTRVAVPGGGQMFAHYPVISGVAEADEVVSVAKMKNHNFIGITGCLKNLFGIMPYEPHGHPRHYYHHLVRMPYMLADLGRIYDPVLNIVDGMIGQAGREWDGEGIAPRVANMIIAGDQVVATDACMAYLMGHQPGADWPNPPFLRDRNALLVAVEKGFGTVDLADIDFVSEVETCPPGTFYCVEVDPPDVVRSWRHTMCEQALYYRDNRRSFDEYQGEYILLQQGNVVWHNKSGRLEVSRRRIAGSRTDQSLYLKHVDPEDADDERYAVYERALSGTASPQLQ